MASALKEEGNAFFGKKEYEKAYKVETVAQLRFSLATDDSNLFSQCYTLAIAADPLNAVLYSNRAAASLALKRHREAELDSGIAISLDKTFQKAFFRRAQARLGQAKYDAALFDAHDAHKMNSTKATAQLIAEIEAARDRAAKEKELVKRPPSEEAIELDPEPEVKPIAVNVASVKEESIVVPVSVKYTGVLRAPSSGFELEATVANIRDDVDQLAQYFGMLSPDTIAKIMGSSLSEDLLRKMCVAFGNPHFDAQLASGLLLALAKAPKCEMVIDFLDDELKGQFRKLFAQWGDAGKPVAAQLVQKYT